MSSLPSPSLSQAAFQTSPSGDIILPSWTESGPTPLNIIVEDPEGEISRSNSPLYSRLSLLHSTATSRIRQTPRFTKTLLMTLGPTAPLRLGTAPRSGSGSVMITECFPSTLIAPRLQTLVLKTLSVLSIVPTMSTIVRPASLHPHLTLSFPHRLLPCKPLRPPSVLPPPSSLT